MTINYLRLDICEKDDAPAEEPQHSTHFLKIDRTLRPEGAHFDPEVLFERVEKKEEK